MFEWHIFGTDKSVYKWCCFVQLIFVAQDGNLQMNLILTHINI